MQKCFRDVRFVDKSSVPNRHKWKKHVLVSAVHILQKFWCRQVRNHQLYVFNFHHHRIHQLKTAIFLWKRKKLQKRAFSFDICANSLKNVIFHFCKNEKHFKIFLFHRKDASKRLQCFRISEWAEKFWHMKIRWFEKFRSQSEMAAILWYVEILICWGDVCEWISCTLTFRKFSKCENKFYCFWPHSKKGQQWQPRVISNSGT